MISNFKFKKISKLVNELEYHKFKSTTMTTVIDDLNTTVLDLTTKLENLEINQRKANITVTGLSLDRSKKQENLVQMLGFFYERMGIEVQIDDVYPLGGPNTKTCVIVFQNIADKRAVLANRALLKGTPYFINDYYPAATNERKRRERDIIKDNKNASQPLDIEYAKGGLRIQGETYRKKVLPPTPRELRFLRIKFRKFLDRKYNREIPLLMMEIDLLLSLHLFAPIKQYVNCTSN